MAARKTEKAKQSGPVMPTPRGTTVDLRKVTIEELGLLGWQTQVRLEKAQEQVTKTQQDKMTINAEFARRAGAAQNAGG